MTRSTASRRARNSDSVMIGGRRRPESRPSRRRWRLASSRVDPRTGWTSPAGSSAERPGPHMHDGVRRLVRPCLVGVLPAAAPASPPPAAAWRVLVALGGVVFRAALAVRGGRCPPAAAVGALPVGTARLLPGVGARLGVGTLAARAATPAPTASALAIRLTVVLLGRLVGGPACPLVAGSRRLAGPATGGCHVVAGSRRLAARRRPPASPVSPWGGGWKITWGGWNVAAGMADRSAAPVATPPAGVPLPAGDRSRPTHRFRRAYRFRPGHRLAPERRFRPGRRFRRVRLPGKARRWRRMPPLPGSRNVWPTARPRPGLGMPRPGRGAARPGRQRPSRTPWPDGGSPGGDPWPPGHRQPGAGLRPLLYLSVASGRRCAPHRWVLHRSARSRASG